MPELKTADAPSWSKFVTDFDSTKRLFDQNYAGLMSMGSYVRNKHPELLAKYNKMVSEAVKHKAVLDKLANIRSTVLGWLNKVSSILPSFGDQSSGFDQGSAGGGGGGGGGGGMWGLEEEQDELGFIPIPVIIGVSSALAALAAIGYWIKDAYVFSRRLNELQRLEGTGLSPMEAARVVDKAAGASASVFGIPVQWYIIGAVVLIAGPAFFRFMRAAKES